MNRVLAFPVLVGAIAALDGCQGTQITDPMVRPCHDDTLAVTRFTDSQGNPRIGYVIQKDDYTTCRKAA